MLNPSPTLFDQPLTAFDLAIQGATLAADKAERDDAGWKDKAWELLLKYLDIKHTPFQCEDFRAWAYENGLNKPNNERAFGAMFIKAAREKLIVRHGYGPTENRTSHCANATIWIKNENE